MKNLVFTLLIIVFIVAFMGISGCATKPPTFGDRILAEGESQIKIAERWNEGKKESIKGEKLVLKGRRIVEKGRANLREGEQAIASGNAAVQTNRQAYQALSQTAQGIDSAETASVRAGKLRKIANAWEDGEAQIADGKELIQRGNARISEGESLISEGQALIKRGRDKMQGAESRYRPTGS